MGILIDTQPKVSIVGAGPAGFALAADLESRGTRVLLYSHPDHLRHTNDVMSKGYLKVNGQIPDWQDPLVTTCMDEVVHFSTTIILTVPSTGQETVLQQLKSFDLGRHIIIAIPGNLFSLVAEGEINAGYIVETNLSPYSCRMVQGELIVLGKKDFIFIAALQRQISSEIRERIQNIIPTRLHWCSSVMEVSLSNVNGVFHPLMMLMNVGRIESTTGDFFLYRDGLTRSVANAMMAVDKVRMQIGEAFGLQLKSAIEVSNECYSQEFTDLVDLAQNSPPHNKLKAPINIENRNISEDVPDLLVSWHGLAKKLEIEASSIKAVIVLVEMATGINYMKTGRNLTKLHLATIHRGELTKRFHAYPMTRKDSGIAIESDEAWDKTRSRSSTTLGLTV